MDDGARLISRLHRVNRTVKEMIRDRKYGVSQPEIDISYDDFVAEHAPGGTLDKTTLNFQAQDEAGEKIYVYYSDEEKKAGVGIKPIRRILEVLDQQSIKKGLFIYDGKLTPAAQKAIQNVRSELGIDVEAFNEAELLVNITHHDLVPNHSVLSPEEKKALLAKYRLKDTQLPRIQLADPVARYYGLRRGQVVKIIRPSETAGRYTRRAMLDALHTYSHARGPAHCAVFNSNGSYVLSGGQDRSIKLVNAQTGALVSSYSGHGYEVLGISVAHDNSRFASCGGDRSAMYWDVPTSTIIKRYTGHNGRINSVAFNSESTVLASGSFDATIRLWDVKSQQGRPIQILQEARDSITCVVIGDREIVASSVDGHVRTYDLRMGELRSDFFDQPLTSVCLTKDAQTMLVTALDSTIHLMDRSDGSELQRYQGHRNTSYRIHSALGHGEATVIAGDEDGKFWRWDLADGKRVIDEAKIADKSVLWVEQSPADDMDMFVAASSDGSVKIWTD